MATCDPGLDLVIRRKVAILLGNYHRVPPGRQLKPAENAPTIELQLHVCLVQLCLCLIGFPRQLPLGQDHRLDVIDLRILGVDRTTQYQIRPTPDAVGFERPNTVRKEVQGSKALKILLTTVP